MYVGFKIGWDQIKDDKKYNRDLKLLKTLKKGIDQSGWASYKLEINKQKLT